MIHNLNIARYLMGRPATQGTMFSDKHAHPDLTCADTEFLKLDFEGNGAAHLFITWAADLAVYDTSGNNREHVDIWYAVTDQGWRITQEQDGAASVLVASRGGEREVIATPPLKETPYEHLTKAISAGKALEGILPTLEEAREDIYIIRKTGEKVGSVVTLSKMG